MPSEADHVALANKNHAALMCLHEACDPHAEWIVTIAFYKAVQVVQAILAVKKRQCHDHTSRHNILKQHYPSIWKHYRPLWQASTIARYLHDNSSHTSYTSFDNYCPPEKVYSRFVEKRLRPIEQIAVSDLSKSSKEALVRVK